VYDDPAQSIRNDSTHSNKERKIQFEMKPPLGCVSDNRIIIDEKEKKGRSKTSAAAPVLLIKARNVMLARI
jgi:hypothetical protein